MHQSLKKFVLRFIDLKKNVKNIKSLSSVESEQKVKITIEHTHTHTHPPTHIHTPKHTPQQQQQQQLFLGTEVNKEILKKLSISQ